MHLLFARLTGRKSWRSEARPFGSHNRPVTLNTTAITAADGRAGPVTTPAGEGTPVGARPEWAAREEGQPAASAPGLGTGADGPVTTVLQSAVRQAGGCDAGMAGGAVGCGQESVGTADRGPCRDDPLWSGG